MSSSLPSTVLEAVGKLKSLVDLQYEQLKSELTQCDDLFPEDYFAFTVINRSMALIKGFCMLIEAENMIAGAPLLRLQIDNVLRFSALWHVADSRAFVLDVMGGKQIRKFKDRSGKTMTDAHLIGLLPINQDWFRHVYERASGEIHLSDRHIWQAIKAVPGSDQRANIKIGGSDAFVSQEVYLDAVTCFANATDTLMGLISLWAEERKRWKQPESISEANPNGV